MSTRNLKETSCVICEAIFHTPRGRRKTCSSECYSKYKSEIASKQTSHGGGKRGEYKGFRCDSTYELAFLIHHLDTGSDIKRSENSYKYQYKGRELTYTPDFIVNGVEVEVKGYLSEKSAAKAESFPEVLLVGKEEIEPIIKAVKTKYEVKNIVDLYETAFTGQKKCLWCEEAFSYNYTKQKFCSPRCNAFHRHSK